MAVSVALAICTLIASADAVGKRGLSGIEGCDDAASLGLSNAWHYNWGVWPTQYDEGGNKVGPGQFACATPQAAEFVPMIWGCWGICCDISNATRTGWKELGVKYLLGFNEPDNLGQSAMEPADAARDWQQLDGFARSFDPPLILVGPGMTHWNNNGSSDWLEQFRGNLSTTEWASIAYLAQHDYSGDADGIISKTNALYSKYGKQVWLTEFAVGNGADRDSNDAFLKEILPKLDAADSVFRYAWYSSRNAPAGWVAESALLPPDNRTGWTKYSGTACNGTEMRWKSQHGTAAECQNAAMDDDQCVSPKTAIYQSGDVQNCYCQSTPTCTVEQVSWQDRYVHHGTEAAWAKTSQTACAGDEMYWLSQHGTAQDCQHLAAADFNCAGPLKTVLYESGDVQNCYCRNATSCTQATSTWLDLYSQPKAPPLSQALTSTGQLYKAN